MAQLSIAVCKQLAQARRGKGMTQSAVAEAAGCKQSAISMLEAGQSVKVSQETVEKIAALLGVTLPAPEEVQPAPSPVPPPALVSPTPHAFCPSAHCPSNVPFMVDDTLLFWPRPQPDSVNAHCAFCGELLEHACPHCKAAVHTAGACCPACGGTKVTDTLPPDTNRKDWTVRRCREITEWRSLTVTDFP